MKERQESDAESENKQVGLEGGTRLFFQLMKCSHFLERETNQILQRFGLKQQQFAVLNEIVVNGPINQRELCDNLLFEKSNVSRIVKILAEANLVRVTVVPLDRRLTYLAETPAGFDRWRECLVALNGASTVSLRGVPEKQLKDEFKVLKRLEKYLAVQRRNGS